MTEHESLSLEQNQDGSDTYRHHNLSDGCISSVEDTNGSLVQWALKSAEKTVDGIWKCPNCYYVSQRVLEKIGPHVGAVKLLILIRIHWILTHVDKPAMLLLVCMVVPKFVI
ncbi:BBT_HP_G0131760.mRNA.1.CDS.1 [Saccharomyces cerevisiae]|nr:BBT_HP_G0131760.mRNA.1.CDS.1 [Saccharomyces cerevisiae]CAI6975432.1 BBT_HP_G0131760.mRNA.1.CDS.1 [Saccharomyces cerevisiae]